MQQVLEYGLHPLLKPKNAFADRRGIGAPAEAFVALAKLRASWYKLGPPHQKLPAGHAAVFIPFGDDMKVRGVCWLACCERRAGGCSQLGGKVLPQPRHLLTL